MAARGHEDRLMARAADLEECLALVLELDLLVVDLPRQEHGAVGGEEIVPRQPLVLRPARPLACGARLRAVGQGGPLHTTRIMALSGGYDHRTGPSLGRDRARKNHRDDLAEDHRRRARDARADLSEARRARPDARARERADDLHPPGRAAR